MTGDSLAPSRETCSIKAPEEKESQTYQSEAKLFLIIKQHVIQ